MSLTQFLAILRARWWVALLVLVLTVGTTVAISLSLPKQYTASATVVVDVKPDPIVGTLYAGGAAPAFMATQVDVIQSDRVAQRVVKNLKLAENPTIRAQWQDATNGQGNIEQWLSETFQKNLDVKPSRESNVITLTYKSPDPRFAAALANAFVKAYLDTTLDLRVDPARQYSTFFDARAKEARERFEAAQSKLSEFQKDKGIIANDERLDIETTRLNELSSQLVMLQALASESGSRQAQAQGASAERMQEVLNNPLISGLKADLSRSEARLQELSARLGESHPQVAEAKANIASVRERLESETQRVTGGVGVTANINRQREGNVRVSLESQRAKVLKLKAVRDEGAVLQRDVESAQRGYEALLARLTQTSLEGQSTQSNVHVLTEASPPMQPSGPRVMTNSMLSLVIGIALAIGAAIALEMLDRRVRVVDDLAAAVGLPVLGMLPRPDAKRLLGGQRVSLMQQRIVASLPAPNRG